MHNYEAGVKWDFFNGKFSTTAALFRTEKHDVATTGCPVAPCNAGNTRTAYGMQVVQGVELGVAGALTEHWKVFGGVA
ncbi:TonB-dependent receptor, partial [Microbacteriaceae bacterium K1510]|nr:TonB-dependent receptor [Microbacteriaceae bacterium K1510]